MLHTNCTTISTGPILIDTFDWSVFWSAFSAIATLLGVIVTCIALIFTFFQLTQPVRKSMQITFNGTYGKGGASLEDPLLVKVHIANIGMRNINIQSFGVLVRKRYTDWTCVSENFRDGQFSNQLLLPEEYLDVLFNHEMMTNEIQKVCKKEKVKSFYFSCKDVHGKMFRSKKVKVKDFENLVDEQYWDWIEYENINIFIDP